MNTGVRSGLTDFFCIVVDPGPYGTVFIWLSRIRIENAYPDPGVRKLTKFIINHGFLTFKKAFCTLVGKFFDLFHSYVSFKVGKMIREASNHWGQEWNCGDRGLFVS